MLKADLPSFFYHKSTSDLVRLGRNNDGGYLVSSNDMEHTEILVSLGICDDWSFETDFVRKKDVPIWAFDASLDFKFWLKRAVINFFKNPFKFYLFRKLLSFRMFFRDDRVFTKRFVGIDANDEAYCTLKTIFEELRYQNIFLKIDVEGSEYRFLDTLIEYQDRVSGLAIELHDCDVHIDKIRYFLENFSLKLVHLHANNYAPVRLPDGLPLAMELTFSKHGKPDVDAVYPHVLDMPNNSSVSEIEISIKD